MLVHEPDHPADALLARIEVHVGVQQEHVARGGCAEDAVQVGGIPETRGVAQHERIAEMAVPLAGAVGRAVVDQDQPHAHALPRGRQRGQEPRHQVPLVGVDEADVHVGSAAHGFSPWKARSHALCAGSSRVNRTKPLPQ